jgi:hypothetical protein
VHVVHVAHVFEQSAYGTANLLLMELDVGTDCAPPANRAREPQSKEQYL